ncbi:MAG: RpiB/LacA/LacB family sugar-phosphate isomerase [Nanoarchaeota archaeon]|nr:RpiB/LacA/LacB family sugar-phosphate isomerase [Nanoarchaeota archaeon]MBU1644260.1 RpiB/LacA/LacB family sugar-phosphate isomerase [Nanoarchaeota archaeon]MBU1976998.1 RpiB/LacA/LacB family sugar-phosphate isomerase [Nanoarchaeota archaeon]
MVKKIYLGSDHAGFKLKEKIKEWLEKKGIPFLDTGNLVLDPNDDYPDYAGKLARKVTVAKSLGILVCGSAQGMCIAANKIKGARAVVPFSLREVRLSRKHNDANIICLSGWYAHPYEAKQMVEQFLTTPFSNEPRHVRRINKIKKLEI